MNYSIITVPFFDKQLKRLIKKYPSLKKEYADLIKNLTTNPAIGVSIGSGCYKIRLAISSKRKGKSGGARVITYLQVINSALYLVSIYDKSEQDSLSDKDLNDLIKSIH